MNHRIKVLLVLLFISVSSSVNAAPYTGSDITLLGTDFYRISSLDAANTPQSGECKWYKTGDGGIWTAWAGLWVEYQAELVEGNWNVGLNVTNHGNLGDNWYSQFEIYNTLSKSNLIVPASDNETNFGLINVDIVNSGLYTVKYTWTNDKYKPSAGLDANIQIDSVFFDNTQTAPVPEPATMLLFGTGLLGIAGLHCRKKKNL